MSNRSHDFAFQRERSKVFEVAFSNWLRRTRGYFVLPTYDFSGSNGDKAPRLMGAHEHLVIPDLLATHPDKGNSWYEVKLKENADLYRKTNTLVTGCALRHYRDYQRVKALTKAPVYLVFIHEKENTVVTGEIDTLPYSHTYDGDKMDRGGTIFFSFERLKRVMTMGELSRYG